MEIPQSYRIDLGELVARWQSGECWASEADIRWLIQVALAARDDFDAGEAFVSDDGTSDVATTFAMFEATQKLRALFVMDTSE